MKLHELISNAGEKTIEHISDLLEKLAENHPDIVRKFKKEEYIAEHGKHLTESVARHLVTGMWHEDGKGGYVKGEMVTPQEAMRLLDGMPIDKQNEMSWDAYTAANTFVHDLAGTNMAKNDILTAARWFWFHDADSDCHKVFRYFKEQMFK